MKFIYLYTGSSVDNCGKSLTHVFWRSEFFDLSQSSIHLVAHSGDHIEHWDHALLVDNCLGPDFCVHLLSSFEMLANVILFLCNTGELLRSVDIDASL